LRPAPAKAASEKSKPVVAKVPEKPKEGEEAAKVVSIDAFRKKP
jgi:hypothetical protein